MLNNKDVFFVCDFETTGLDLKKDYPIELGGVFIDSDFNILETFESFIYWEDISRKIRKENKGWPEEYLPAHAVHNIDVIDYLRHSKHSTIIAKTIESICKKLKQDKGHKKPIIISDNSRFEHDFMFKIFDYNNIEFPFHFNSWDINLIFEIYKIKGKAKKTHRALADAMEVYMGLVELKEYDILKNEEVIYKNKKGSI